MPRYEVLSGSVAKREGSRGQTLVRHGVGGLVQLTRVAAAKIQHAGRAELRLQVDTSVLDDTVGMVAAAMASVSDTDQLDALEVAERSGKARLGVLRAIDARIGALMAEATP